MLHILITNRIGNILNCHVAIFQQRLGTFHSGVCNVFSKCFTGFIFNILGNVWF